MSGTADAPPRAGATESSPVREGEIIAGKYVAEGVLGSGGMGVVIAARDQLLDRRVAIKFLLSRLASADIAAERFVREARAATRITSEHGVKVLEVGTLPSGLPFLVMEHLEGCDLRSLLREEGPLPTRRAVDYVLQALQAIAEAHVKSIVHRDIKPSNLFLTRRADGTALIKVLDFGIAKTLELEPGMSTTITGSQDTKLGSPLYMSPEQLRDPRDVDKRSDIWALGVTLYELLTGSTPFAKANPFELVSKVLSEDPQSLRLRRPDLEIPSGLELVVSTCLARARDQRFANAAELAAGLAPFGSEEAALSLARIRGLTPRETSTLAPESPVPTTPVQAYDGTLPAATERGQTITDFGRTPDSHRNRAPLSSRRVAALAFLALALPALFVAARAHVPGGDPAATSAGSAVRLKVQGNSVETDVGAPTPAAPPAPSAKPTPSSGQETKPASAPSGLKRKSEPRVALPARVATAPLSSDAPSPAQSASNALDPLELERLITQRH